MNKYHANRCVWQGMTFDSQKELERYIILRDDEKHGKIRDLQRQVKYTLFSGATSHGERLRPCAYVADFVYVNSSGETVVEDVKGMKTDAYILKKKWMYDKFGIYITET